MESSDDLRNRIRQAREDAAALRRAVDALDGRVAKLEALAAEESESSDVETPAPDPWSALAERERTTQTVRRLSLEAPPSPRTEEAGEQLTAAEPAKRPELGAGRLAELVEEHLGTKWFNWVGILAIIFAAAYFLKYSFEQGWVTSAMLFYSGLAGGALLLGCGHVAQKRSYPTLARGFWGGGIALLFLVLFAGFKLLTTSPAGDPIIGREVAFLGMVATAATGAVLSIVHRSRAVAILAALGGYLTPVLLSTGQVDQAFLFTYLAILTTGFLVIGHWMRWRFMPGLCWTAAVLYFSGWWLGEYPGHPPLTVLFLCLFFLLFTAEAVVGSAVLRLDTGRVTSLRTAATAILFAGGMLYLLHDLYPAWQGAFALIAAAAHLAPALLIARRQPSARRLARVYGHAAAVLLLVGPVVAERITGRGITVAWLGTGVLLLAAGRLADTGRARFWGFVALVVALVRLCIVDTPDLLSPDREGILLFGAPGLLYAIATACLWAACGTLRLRPVLGAQSRPLSDGADGGSSWTEVERIADSLLVVAATAMPLALLWLGVDDLFRNLVASHLDRTSTAYAHHRGLGLTFVFAAYATLVTTVARRRREPVLVWFGVALAGATAAKMLVGDLAIGYVRAGTPLVNARFGTVAFLSACAFWLSREACRDEEGDLSLRSMAPLFLVASHLLVLCALGMEWVDFSNAHANTGPGSAAVGAPALGVAALLAIYGAVVQACAPRGRHSRVLACLGAVLLGAGTGLWLLRCLILRAPAPHPVAHFRFLSGAAIAAALFAAGRICLGRQYESDFPNAGRLLSALPLLAANALVIVMLTLEAHDFFAARGRSLHLPEWLDPVDAGRLSFSVIWTLYAIGMVVAGFIRSFRPVRVMALVVLLGTTLKVFVFDLAFLTGMYRVLSFLTLGLILVAVAYAYQRHGQALLGHGDEHGSTPDTAAEA